MSDKFIQIMPAKNLYAKFKDGEDFFFIPIICLALDERGEIHCVEMDKDGFFSSSKSQINFDSFAYSALNIPVGILMSEKEIAERGI